MDQKKFVVQTLSRPLHISGVVSVFFSDITPNFSSRGERHDCWELVYVDRGYIHVETDTRTYPLTQGQITFHPPMEYHRHSASATQEASLCISAFQCEDMLLEPLTHGPFTLDEEQRRILSHTLRYGTDIFSSLVDAQDALYLIRKSDSNPIGEQIFSNYLEVFLLLCLSDCVALREFQSEGQDTREVDVLSRNRIENLGKRTVDYLMDHVQDPITIGMLCSELGYSKTTLSTSFKAYTGTSIISYFNRLKIETAKTMIRTEDMSLTEIASRLNFCNLNYFSTAFKRYAGMYPREYAKSLKVHHGVYLVNLEHDSPNRSYSV